MFHGKRFKLASLIILVLLLTVALAPMAAAQDVGDQNVGDQTPPPPGTGDDMDDNGDDDPTSRPGGDMPPDTGDNGDMTPPPPDPPDRNGDMNGDDDMMMGMPADWPPPNALVIHPATPIQISALGGGLQVYFIGPDGATHGPLLPNLGKLAEMYDGMMMDDDGMMGGMMKDDDGMMMKDDDMMMSDSDDMMMMGNMMTMDDMMMTDAGNVLLFSGTNPGTGKPVTIQYLPDRNVLHVSTFYADKPPHDYDKAYIFTVDANHSVHHEQW